MKQTSFLLTALLVCLTAISQNVFTLDGASGTRVYSNIDSALKYSADGDYLYLPAGNISAPQGFMVKNKLNIIGAGHYPDSTQATGQTVITGNVHFWTESSGSVLQGVYISSNIYFGVGPSSGGAKNILISRCNVNTIHLSIDGGTFYGAENVFIKDNVLRDAIAFAYVKNVVVENNLIEGALMNGDGLITVRNNVFLRRTPTLINTVRATRFENNIFLVSSSFFGGDCTGNLWYNNCFKEVDPLGTQFSTGNKFNVTDLFVNQTGTSFQYTDNYHLTALSPAKAAGFAATDCGIFGGNNPYKEGAVPVNPHIRAKNLPSQTDAQGKINVQVTVAAQNN